MTQAPDERTVTFSSTDKDGNSVKVTLRKGEDDKGSVQVRKWKKGKDPKTETPDENETTELFDIKKKADGTKIASKHTASTWFGDVVVNVTFTIRCPDPPEKPSVTVDVTGTPGGLKDSSKTYIISEEDQNILLDWIKKQTFSPLSQAINRSSGLALLLDLPNLFSRESIDRFSLALSDIADSIMRRSDDWVENKGMLSFVGFDPGVSANIYLEGPIENAALVLLVRLSTKALKEPYQFKQEFINPMRLSRFAELREISENTSVITDVRETNE